ncbi:MAG: hypothetical protein DRH12_05335 [Deltaproteobacteria bacterium]|nr:MAG: hypothetical protein DRH12_05335 [Deltaproteobacteria bacterium]
MKSLLIRAEDKNEWERRVPIVPNDVRKIIKETGARVFVQRSNKRFFTEGEYRAAGAIMCDDMEPGDVIFGIKEIPEEKIIPNKTYVFFSHTIKGQPAGMPLLRKIISSGSTLIDYERITDNQNRRLVYFGDYAGAAGTIDMLSIMGEYWHYHGISTVFKSCKRAHEYRSLSEAKAHFREIGSFIESQGLPNLLCPLTIGIMGYGNVSKGAQSVLECLPHKWIKPSELERLAHESGPSRNKVYIAIFKEKDMVQNIKGHPFRLDEYYEHPEYFSSIFDQYLPYLSIVINAIYWDKRYPRFITWDSLRQLYQNSVKPKLNGIADISCDVNGAVECNVKATDSAMPAYLCDPVARKIVDGHEGDGVVILAVDNLPCELPMDSSIFFSSQLTPFVPNILNANYSAGLDDSGLWDEIRKAVIVYRGRLTKAYEYLNEFL